MSRRRHLSDDEQALWTGVTRAVTPLRPTAKSNKLIKLAAKPSVGKPGKATAKSAVGTPPPSRVQPRPVAPPPALAPLGRRLKQRVARGREPIDGRIDLHGMTQAQAHTALFHFLQRARADGAKTILVITGKGSGHADRERGVLKRQVPMWLALPEFRPLIVGFDDAHVGHGGEGALYVRLRRSR
jgi:DNA-nicking Smr family endonuclease